jgi:hypothetical protein
MESMVTQMTNPTKSPKIEARAMNFFRYIATVSPQAAELVGANLGSAPSKRWMRSLNARERVACVYECQLSEMQKQMSDAINKRLVAKQTTSTTSFSIAIDATKVSQLLEISTAFKAIMGGAHPHHMILTIDLDSPTIKNILDHREYLDEVIDIASEVKVAFMVFQKPPPGVSPIVIISAWPQSNNECSSFTADIMNAADFVTRQFPSTSFVNFAVDGVSLETKDVMTTICNFLGGRCNFTGAVDNKHNVKNDRYQLIGGSGVPIVGKYVADVDLIRQAGVPEDLFIVKDFASDKKVEELFSYGTMKKIEDAMIDGRAIGLIEDYGALAVTMLFLRIHLHAMNARLLVSQCRAMYLWMSMILFTSLTGVNITPKRNMVSETISNIFIVMRSDIQNPRYCTSEPAEHGFGNTRRSQREFTCSDFASHVEKENRRMKTMFEGELSPSREQLKGYQETFLDFIEHGMNVQRSAKMLVGPCNINLQKDALPVSTQLWPYVRKIIREANQLMIPFLKLLGVTSIQMSPFCKDFTTIVELKEAYVLYCPRTFTYDDFVGMEDEEEIEQVEDDGGEQAKEAHVAAKIKEFADQTSSDTDDYENDESKKDYSAAATDDYDNDESKKDNDEEKDDGVDDVLPSVTKGEKTLDSAMEASQKLWKTIVDLVKCDDMRDVFALALSASASIQSIERSSLSHGRKHNSFLGRWFGTDNKKGTEDDIVVATDSEVMIERDRLILSQIKNIAKVSMRAKYRVIGVYDKSYNKWFMAKENKKHWMSLSQQERKKYKVAIRMVEDVDTESLSENDCEDVSFHDARFKQGDICKIVHGNEICDVLRFMHKYE